MSTQKPESRWQLTSCIERANSRVDLSPANVARYVYAIARDLTAPLFSAIWIWAGLATKFLLSDYHLGQLAQPVIVTERRGSPPPGAGRPSAFGRTAPPRSSLSRISLPTGSPRFPQAWLQAPDGIRRRAERYDGKRDLYFLHAA